MIGRARIIHLASAAVAACGVLADAPGLAQGVKIGILNDQSGVYADFSGKGSVEGAKMAIEDFGGRALGEKIELVTADHQNKPDLASAIARRVRRRRRRHDHRPQQFLGRARGAADRR
jgi:branched-chain amino acid transport system substrate-binding protein